METITIPRTGDRPLEVAGELLSEATSHQAAGPGRFRWHELKLYRTAQGLHILHIGYRSIFRSTQGEVEPDHDAVGTWSNLDADALAGELSEYLGHYRPVRHVVGYPPIDRYEKKQSALVQNILDRFRHCVTELLSVFCSERVA